MNDKIFDLVIIGAGSAGLSAGIYATRAKLNTLIIEKSSPGGQITKTSEIVNYPGIRKTSGHELMEEMRLQAEDFGVKFQRAEVNDVDLSNEVKILKTDIGEIKGRAVIIATGATPRKLGFPGEEEFAGRGVAYCATCDGEFFKGLEVLVIGAGFAACEEAIYLTRFAKKVTIIAREPDFTCAKSIGDKVKAHPKIDIKFNTEVVEAIGDDLLRSVKLINNVTYEKSEYFPPKEDGTFGIFIFAGYVPQTSVFKNHIELDNFGYIITDENMQTNIKGVYAAGDLRPKSLRQVVTAVADGAIAATDAEKYIFEEKERLGIADEVTYEAPVKKESNETTTNNVKKSFNGKSHLLNDTLRTQLSSILSKIENPITLVTIVDPNNGKSIELRDLVLDIANLSDKLKAEVYIKNEAKSIEEKINADKYPVVALLDKDNNYSGVKFHGVPGGHELNSFILAIYNLAGPGQPIDPNNLEKIKSINKATNIKVCVSLSCHLCPDVVVSAQRIAIENPNVETEMLDLANFDEIKTKYKLMSVPAIIVNDSEAYFGAKKLDEILNII